MFSLDGTSVACLVDALIIIAKSSDVSFVIKPIIVKLEDEYIIQAITSGEATKGANIYIYAIIPFIYYFVFLHK